MNRVTTAIMIGIIAIGVSLVGTGCAAMKAAEEQRKAELETAKNARYDVTIEQLRQTILTVLVQLDYRIERQDERTGYFETQWGLRSMYGTSHRVRILGQVLGDRPYSVDLKGEVITQESVTPEKFEDEITLRIYEMLESSAQ
jgi:hypothetical protein